MKKIHKNLVAKNFSLWKKFLKNKNEKEITGLYENNVSFLPTLSKKFKTKKKEVAEYFQHFLKNKPRVKILKDKIQTISQNCYIHSGLYNFFLEKRKKTIKARFTFIWKKNRNGNWKIIHHHSSLLPK